MFEQAFADVESQEMEKMRLDLAACGIRDWDYHVRKQKVDEYYSFEHQERLRSGADYKRVLS